ncbi:MAG TPA: HAMP domain-containing protein, partial [Magnetococcales bacterium]|nr:HAMP domain-containing protein [Magnetococcales bacterium]
LFILLVGLTFSHILSILVFTSEKLEPAVLTSENQVLERMAVVTRMLLDIPASQHPSILFAMNHSGMHFDVLSQPSGHQEPASNQNDEALRQRLEEAIRSPQTRVVAVTASQPDWNHQHGEVHRLLFKVEMSIIRMMHDAVMDRELRAWVDLPTGQRILMENQLTENHVPLFRHATISVIIMTGAIILFALVVAQYMTLPLKHIVEAANTVGRDVYSAPLREKGPTEVIAVARAFNRMNRRIREFVEDRLYIIAAISHDLRTPLTKLKLMAEFVGDENTRERMVVTLDEMESMLATTLNFARDAITVESKQQVNLSGLLGAICADMNDAGQPVDFEDTDKMPCLCRPLTLKRTLTNLIHNAVTYGGCAHVSLKREKDRFIITIRDSGPGIPENEWDNVFKPFLRLDPSRSTDTGGVGLGLSIAASAIRDHNGTIRFAYPPDGGFATQVELPVGSEKTPPTRSPAVLP